ncbi:short-chain dehydrogenase/reductase family 42E member 1 [Platysternon megacephalum]|uniref:Short-chain dehydrogenase/reductase family 42E member 1 n=1 Tax=Platysternon megacephalum TaxID=55544 RepID=A0A4D9EHL7_9SAUR|nr:short-chain dehydrogenase/reductase family 42E member 1 [Platysternon megacephalum]
MIQVHSAFKSLCLLLAMFIFSTRTKQKATNISLTIGSSASEVSSSNTAHQSHSTLIQPVSVDPQRVGYTFINFICRILKQFNGQLESIEANDEMANHLHGDPLKGGVSLFVLLP